MEHNNKWMCKFVDGKWTGREDRMITIFNGSVATEHNIDDLAKEQGIELPDSPAKPKAKAKKTINKDIDIQENRHEDMEGTLDRGHTEEHDGGDGEG
jgi:aconitase B